MSVKNPVIVATSEILWLRENGQEVVIQAIIKLPYEQDGTKSWFNKVSEITVEMLRL